MSINQSVNQSINQSINQPINQSINQSIYLSIHQSINLSICGLSCSEAFSVGLFAPSSFASETPPSLLVSLQRLRERHRPPAQWSAKLPRSVASSPAEVTFACPSAWKTELSACESPGPSQGRCP